MKVLFLWVAVRVNFTSLANVRPVQMATLTNSHRGVKFLKCRHNRPAERESTAEKNIMVESSRLIKYVRRAERVR